jgi:hypothetical protein
MDVYLNRSYQFPNPHQLFPDVHRRHGSNAARKAHVSPKRLVRYLSNQSSEKTAVKLGAASIYKNHIMG